MNRILQINLSKERICNQCGKAIKAGEGAVKSISRHSACSATEIYNVYYHLDCWRVK